MNTSHLMTNTITILAMLAILSGAILSIIGLTVISSVDAQMTGDNATMSGNMTGGNVTGGNRLDPISDYEDFKPPINSPDLEP